MNQLLNQRMEKSALFTTSWDDGHPLDLRVAELLAKYDLTGTFYIPLENSRPVMSAQQIREVGRTFEIGAHTIHHVVLTEVSEEAAEAEVQGCKGALEDLTGRSCEAFCFPKGQFRHRHLEMVRRAGFRTARTVALLSTRFPMRRAGLAVIPTSVQATPHRWIGYLKNAAKRRSPRSMANFFLHVRARQWPEIARSMLDIVARRGGVFHLWGHSWEIEEQQQWTHLETVLREMHQLRSSVACVTNSQLLDSGPHVSSAACADCGT